MNVLIWSLPSITFNRTGSLCFADEERWCSGMKSLICRGRHPNVVCFYDLPAAERYQEMAVEMPVELFVEILLKRQWAKQIGRLRWCFGPKAPRGKCVFHHDGSLPASFANSSVPARHPNLFEFEAAVGSMGRLQWIGSVLFLGGLGRYYFLGHDTVFPQFY